jgi:RNA polymerase sigma-70 factor, ECF subfamily
MSRSDEELMQEFQKGNETAFISLYERYKLAIYRFLYRKVNHQGRAEDLTQEVFVALIEHCREWRQESSFKTYLYRIAFNRAISELRRAEHKVMIAGDDEANAHRTARVASNTISPAAAVEQQEMQVHVQRALAQLEPEQRDPIILREYEGLSYEEIAEILGVPIGTIKSRIFRGKVELKRLLEPVMSASVNQVAKPPNLSPPGTSPPLI